MIPLKFKSTSLLIFIISTCFFDKVLIELAWVNFLLWLLFLWGLLGLLSLLFCYNSELDTDFRTEDRSLLEIVWLISFQFNY